MTHSKKSTQKKSSATEAVPSQDRFYDNTRLQDSRTCLRYFYFRHERGWVPEGLAAALAFGSAWHVAMDVVWAELAGGTKVSTSDVVAKAYLAWEQDWTSRGFPGLQEMGEENTKDLNPRTPMVAMEMLYEYVERRRELLASVELLAVEKPFAVSLDPNDSTLLYVGRRDKDFRRRGKVYVAEHKTTTSYRVNGPISETFIAGFSPNAQIDGYLHSGHIDYGDALKSVWVDAALVHKNVHDGFVWIPVERRLSQLDAWLWETRYYVDQIEANRAAMAQGAGDGPYLAAWPKNTNSCINFNRPCPYLEPCKGNSNPERIKDTPPGYRHEPWSPFTRLGLSELGLTQEATE